MTNFIPFWCILYLLLTPLLFPTFCLFPLHALELPPIHCPGYGFVCLHCWFFSLYLYLCLFDLYYHLKFWKIFKFVFITKLVLLNFQPLYFMFYLFPLVHVFLFFSTIPLKWKYLLSNFFYISQNKYFLKWCSFLECSIYFPFLLQNFSEVLFIPLLELKRQDISVIFKHTNNK